jgi:hypothetical protein
MRKDLANWKPVREARLEGAIGNVSSKTIDELHFQMIFRTPPLKSHEKEAAYDALVRLTKKEDSKDVQDVVNCVLNYFDVPRLQ